jgi:predicted dehydrogenase
VRLAIVGTGNMARAHAQAFSDLEGVEIVGVAGRSIESIENFGNEFKIEHKHTSIKNLYRTTQADLVVIAVDIDQTSEILRSCAEYPWVILTEKPLGVDLAEAKKLFSLLCNHVDRIFVALNRRHYSTFNELIKNVESKSGPRIITVLDQENQFDAQLAGMAPHVVDNWMFANSIHLIDLMRNCGRGKVTDIKSYTSWRSMEKMEHHVSLTFDSGDFGTYKCQWNDVGPWSLSVETDGSKFMMKPLEKLLNVSDRGRIIDITPQSSWDLNFKPGFRTQAEMMLRKMGDKPSTIVSFLDAFETMQLVHHMYHK